MKKILSLLLAALITASLITTMTATASAAYTLPDITSIERVITAIGIMVGDENGNMNLSNSVTRAEFTKMLIAASTYKDSVNVRSSSSPFKDVKSTHWASGYIKTAVDAGWIVGYLDGTFRPNNTVLFEEAASAILKLLGYDPSDYIGSYPNAQISKITSLGIATGLSAQQGSPLTRGECMVILYNLLSAKQKSGTVYGAFMGYPVDNDGYFDYDSYVDSKMEGPFVLAAGTLASALPFSLENAKLYHNGKTEAALSSALYDVYYYNELSMEVWTYSNRVIGLYTAVNPNSVSPASITVGGNNYNLGTAEAKRKVSASGSFAYGDTVALLIGMNGDVVDIIEAGLVDATYYGMLMSVEMLTYNTGVGQSAAEYFATVACTDGEVRQCIIPGDYYTKLALVSIRYENGKSEMKRLSTKNLSGTVNSTGSGMGEYVFAENIEIMEISDKGDWTTLKARRLAGAELSSKMLQYYLLNEKNEIEKLILKDTTGDMYSYGIITSVAISEVTSETGEVISSSRTYSYIINGTRGSFETSGSFRGLDKNLGFLTSKDNNTSSMQRINRVTLTDISTLQMTAVGDNKRFVISDNAQVYLNSNGSYVLTELSAVSDTSAYLVYGYYESEFPAGGQIRIIVAARKEST